MKVGNTLLRQMDNILFNTTTIFGLDIITVIWDGLLIFGVFNIILYSTFCFITFYLLFYPIDWEK